jgi:hypothetical protein
LMMDGKAARCRCGTGTAYEPTEEADDDTAGLP